jgi:hypothetical protein
MTQTTTPIEWNPEATATPTTREQKWNIGPFGTGLKIALGACVGVTLFFILWAIAWLTIFVGIGASIAHGGGS